MFRDVIMQTGPMMEHLSATLWTSEGVREPVVSKPQSLNKPGDLGRGSSAPSLGLHLLS